MLRKIPWNGVGLFGLFLCILHKERIDRFFTLIQEGFEFSLVGLGLRWAVMTFKKVAVVYTNVTQIILPDAVCPGFAEKNSQDSEY